MTPTYEIRVEGHLDPHWSTRLGDLTHHPDGTTSIIVTGDQSRLYGVLATLRDLTAVLLELRVFTGGGEGS